MLPTLYKLHSRNNNRFESSWVDCSWGFPGAQSERKKSEESAAKLTAARRGTPSGGDLVGPDSVYYVGLPLGQGVVGFGKLG